LVSFPNLIPVHGPGRPSLPRFHLRATSLLDLCESHSLKGDYVTPVSWSADDSHQRALVLSAWLYHELHLPWFIAWTHYVLIPVTCVLLSCSVRSVILCEIHTAFQNDISAYIVMVLFFCWSA